MKQNHGPFAYTPRQRDDRLKSADRALTITLNLMMIFAFALVCYLGWQQYQIVLSEHVCGLC